MFEKAILPLALGACLALAAPAWAEGDSPDNPKPLADDVALPLPCGGEMVFRHVYVLAEGALDDRDGLLGGEGRHRVLQLGEFVGDVGR